MPLLNSLALASTLPEIESIWRGHLTALIGGSSTITAWLVRWVFSETGFHSVSVNSGYNDPAIDDFLSSGRDNGNGANVIGLEHPHLPTGLYLSGSNPTDLSDALKSLDPSQITQALANSFHVLRAHIATQSIQTLLQSELPVLLIDPAGAIYKYTPLAFALLHAPDSEARLDNNRQLLFRSPANEIAFKAALKHAFANHRIPHKIRCAGYSMAFTAASPAARPPMAALVLRKLDVAPKVDVRELQAEFKLTLSQARLAKALIAGESLQEYSERMNLSPKGVKWHLHPLMKRLECTTREQLMLKLLRWAG